MLDWLLVSLLLYYLPRCIPTLPVPSLCPCPWVGCANIYRNHVEEVSGLMEVNGCLIEGCRPRALSTYLVVVSRVHFTAWASISIPP
ncbi:hypothetical protein B0T24DRAFT_612116 [Lasiosphaeria ovina]|uniref:Secreted protein n=1 Tax=Lasiosphaeria ovina TaxID=92902 RepID=A0AAE0KN55_9PEZI|nr:hypothetical protein B0T24DRAFT_612116 [Lasiosphaeria ovina]